MCRSTSWIRVNLNNLFDGNCSYACLRCEMRIMSVVQANTWHSDGQHKLCVATVKKTACQDCYTGAVQVWQRLMICQMAFGRVANLQWSQICSKSRQNETNEIMYDTGSREQYKDEG